MRRGQRGEDSLADVRCWNHTQAGREMGFHLDSTGHWILCESGTSVRVRFGERHASYCAAAFVRHRVESGGWKLLRAPVSAET